MSLSNRSNKMRKYNIVLWEDYNWDRFYPLSLTRPLFDLRIGTERFVDRALDLFEDRNPSGICRPELKNILQDLGIQIYPAGIDPDLPTVFLNGTAVFTKKHRQIIDNLDKLTVLTAQEKPVAVYFPLGKELDILQRIFESLPSEKDYNNLMSLYPIIETDVPVFDSIWDLVYKNPEIIISDFEENFSNRVSLGEINDRAAILGTVFVNKGAIIDPFAVLDGRNGPVIIEKDVYVMSGAVIIGPAYIGEGTNVMPYARIREGTSIGPVCRIGGEVEESIFLGYSNKFHDGFIGHSYIGKWVNLGALTTNSDLKNNYHEIRVTTPEKVHSTGLNKVGTFIGDHSKLGIGTLLTSGSTVGVAANFFGGGLAPKVLPSFLWGSLENGFESYYISKAIETAIIVMSRRDSGLSRAEEVLLRNISEQSESLHSNF